jgi:heat shock protein HspQ
MIPKRGIAITMTTARAQFSVGQLVEHKLFSYRGVIVDVDPQFQGTEEWYEHATYTHPPKDEPWYRVLVHDSDRETYVAERNLEPDASDRPVNHPALSAFFSHFRDGVYIRLRAVN